MFDYVTNAAPSVGRGGARFVTRALSALAHVTAVVLLVVPALYATDVLPKPPEMLAFVVNGPPPPPPPPAPATREPRPKPTKPRPPRRGPPPEPRKAPRMAAPVEAPDTISDETGLEGNLASIDDMAGFEYGLEGGLPGGIVGGIEATLPPPPPPPAPVRIGGNIKPPRLTHRVEPQYPLLAQSARVEGMVVLEATVDERGQVRNVRALRTHPALDGAAIRAVELWRYQPLVLNGVPMPFIVTVTVSFTLADQ